MLCDICHKNEATIHIQEIVNGEKKSLNLCADCAAKKPALANLQLGVLNLGEMLFNLNNQQQADTARSDNAEAALSCPHCHWTLDNLRESGGRLGCPKCYEVFAHLIEPALGSIHRGKVHIGKTPDHQAAAGLPAADTTGQIALLQLDMQRAIKAEEYERAAELRDRIAELQKKTKKRGKK